MSMLYAYIILLRTLDKGSRLGSFSLDEKERGRWGENVFMFADLAEKHSLLAFWFRRAAVRSGFSDPSPEQQWSLVCGF